MPGSLTANLKNVERSTKVSIPEMMHGRTAEVFLHQFKLETSPYDIYSVGVT